MKLNQVAILCAQETHVAQNTKEKRTDYTWYLNGNEEGEREFAGMAAVVQNSTHKHLIDVIPHCPRIMELQLAGPALITILNIYAPQAGRPQAEK